MSNTRPPIVVILGHVDHGKTSLLDALLKTSVAAGEVGGITQSTRAFQARGCTFVDTPGHGAFAAMRARGGQIADLALLVVSGVDGVMPQTKESIAVIKTAAIPTVVAVTKADLPEFSLDKIKGQLAENNVLVEGFGGDVPVVSVSAKTGQGLDQLLELITLLSQMHPPTADTEAALAAVVLESRLDAKRGPVAVVVVRNGTLRVGKQLYLGSKLVGKAKALAATSGEKLEQALPSTPVEILGLTEVLPVGVVISDSPGSEVPSTEALAPSSRSAGFKIILKADTQGSLEAVTASLPPEVVVVEAATGDVSESDVLLAASTGAVIVGFNVKIPTSVAKLAEIDKVKIVTSKVIYELLDQVGLLISPPETEKVVGQAQILAEFKIDSNRVAGGKVIGGQIAKSAAVRVGEKLARIKSLRTGKTEVESVGVGTEFGAIFSPPIDFKIGDSIIALEHG